MRDDAFESSKGLLPDSIRKALVTGISAIFMTEEGIRNTLAEMRLPKDAMGYLVQQTERTRKELFRVVSQELKGFLKGADLPRELRAVLKNMKVQVRAEVRFVDENDPPEVTVKSRVRRRKKTGTAPRKKTSRKS